MYFHSNHMKTFLWTLLLWTYTKADIPTAEPTMPPTWGADTINTSSACDNAGYYYSEKDTDILQEYFIPIESFSSFINEFRKLIIASKINLLSVTTRYMPKNKESLLSYSEKTTIAIVIYVNQELSPKEVKKTKKWTQKLVDIAYENGGTYYLTYQKYPSKKQFRQHYPLADEFVFIKHKIV